MNEFDPDLQPVAERLNAERPVPRAGFRAQLRSQLRADASRRPMRVGRLRLLIAANAVTGAVMLLVVAAGVAGAGPLAA